MLICKYYCDCVAGGVVRVQRTWARNGHCYYHREQLHSRACLNREVQVDETEGTQRA